MSSRVLRPLLILLLCGMYRGSAQVIKFDHYTTGDGLLSDEVYNLYQDRKGYLWMFTNYGAMKFNGDYFKPVLKNLNVEESFVYSFYEHPGGRKWIATSLANIYEVVDDSVVQVKGTEEVSATIRKDLHEIMSLYADDSLNLYAVTKHHSYKFTREGDRYRGRSLTPGPGDSITYRVYEMDNTTLGIHNFNGNDTTYCGGLDKIPVQVNLKSGSFFHHIPCRQAFPKHIKKFGRYVYVLHHDHLIRLGKAEYKAIPLGAILHNFTQDNNGHTWVATYQNGLLELDENDSLVHHYFGNITVNDVLQDHQGGFWVSTAGFGLFHCPDLNHRYFERPHPMSLPVTLVKAISRGVVAGSSGGDLFLFESPSAQPRFLTRLSGEDVMDVEEMGDTLFLITRYSVQNLLLKEDRVTELPRQKTNIYAHTIVKEGGQLYYIHRKRISVREGNTNRLWNIFNRRIFTLAFKGNSAFVGTDNGLSEYSKSGTWLRDIRKFDGIRIKKVITTPANELLCIAPGHGLFIFDGKDGIRQVTTKEGLPGNYIDQVRFEDFGTILALPDGLFFSPHADGGLLNLKWTRFYTGSTKDFAVLDSCILIGTVGGMVMMSTSQLKESPDLKFHVSPLIVNGQPFPDNDLRKLKHSQNNIEVGFDVVTFGKTRPAVRYELSGPYSDRGVINASPLKLSQLPPGSYELKIWPETRDPRRHLVARRFIIRPALWQTPTFLMAVLLVLFFALLFASALVSSYFQRKRNKRAQAENKLLEYKLIALKAQINPHFMSNCLSAIQHLIISNRVDEASDYIAKFGFLVRQILNYSNRSLISLQEELSLASLFMDLEQLRFERKFTYVIQVQPEIDVNNTMIPALILNPIIENAIWHGLLPVKDKRNCQIRIEAWQKDGRIEVSVADNGVGRKVAVSKQADRQSKGEGLIAERLHNINLLYNTNACNISYTDLYTGDTTQGTKVTLTLPLHFKQHAHA